MLDFTAPLAFTVSVDASQGLVHEIVEGKELLTYIADLRD